MDATIEVRHVSKGFKRNQVLRDISLKIYPGEVFGLLGPSGSGKTTLIKLMAGIDVASEGSVFVMSTPMPNLDVTGRIGYMAQSDALYTELTAKENLDFFASVFGLRGQCKQQRMKTVMELVGLSDSMKKLVSNYSGGMKRRLSLAIALLHHPKVLILDEPTVGIDPLLRQSIWEELHQMSSEGTTILVTTHVMDEATRCHRLGMIRDGRLIATGSPTELMQRVGVSTIEEAFLAYGRDGE